MRQYPGILCAVAIACALAAHGARAQQPALPGTTRLVDVGGHAVHVLAAGLEQRVAGNPVVVFEAGATNSLDVWSRVMPQVAAGAPVVAYDRAGLGQSEWDGATPTPQHVAARLRRLLDAIGAPPPYVLVGFSWGGTLARYFAGLYPTDIAGIVYVDPGPIVTQTAAETVAPFDAIGAGRAGYDAYWSAFAALVARASPAARAEFDVFRSLMELDPAERALRPVPDVPVAVIVAARHLPLTGMQLPFDDRAHFDADVRHRIRMLQEWTLASPHGTLVVSNHTTHAVPREDPELIVWAVRRVLAAAR